MNLPRIGRAISIAASNCIGTTTHALSTFQCRDISKSSSKKTSIKFPPNHNIAQTRQHRNNTGPKPSPAPSQHLPQIIRRWNKGNTMNHQKHFVLRTSGQQHGPHGPQLNRKQTNTRHHKHNGKGQTIVGLPRHTSGRDHSVLSVGHDLECPLGCILSLGSEGTYLCKPKNVLAEINFGWENLTRSGLK